MVVESNSVLGGCATISGGILGIGGGNALQIKAGIYETADTLYSDMTRHVVNYTNVETKALGAPAVYSSPGTKTVPALARVFADRSLDTWNWLVAHGAKFSAATTSYANGTAVFWGTRAPSTTVADVVDPTGVGATHPQSTAGGAGWCNPMIAALKKMSNVDIELNTKMTQIIREAPLTGRVLGITAQAGGKTMYFRANRAVIVATGGYKGSPWLRFLFDPRVPATMTYSGTPFCYDDGTGLLAALNAGAAMMSDRNLDIHEWHRQWGTLYHVFSLGSAYATPGLSPSTADYIFVNSLGNRFMDESTPETSGWFFGDPPYSFYDYALDQHMTGPYGTPGVWTIMDSAAMTRENLNPSTWLGPPAQVDPNLVFSGATLGALETAINVPAGSLTATITKYNSYVAASPPADPDFGRPASLLTHQINTPPYYAVWCNLVLHDTAGCCTVNENGQVIDWNGNTIQSLYAAGEAAGGLDLIGMAKGVVMGRVCGENAAVAQSW